MLKLKRNINGISLLKRRTWFDESGISTASDIIQGESVEHTVSPVPKTPPTQPEITDDVIKNHPLYKQLLSESVARRQTIKQLEEQFKNVLTPTPAAETVSDNSAPPQKGLTEDAVEKRIADALAKRDLKASQDKLLDQFKVPNEVRELWRDNDVEAMQKRLTVAFGGPLGGGSPGNGSGNDDPHADIRTRIRARISGQGENPGEKLYEPSKQRELGGGIVLN